MPEELYSEGLTAEQAVAALEAEEQGETQHPAEQSTEASPQLAQGEGAAEEGDSNPKSLNENPDGDKKPPEEEEEGEQQSGEDTEAPAPSVKDISDLPDTAVVKMGDSEVAVADLKEFTARRAAQEEAAAQIKRQREQVSLAQNSFTGALRAMAEDAQKEWESLASSDFAAIKQEFLNSGDAAGWDKYVAYVRSVNERAEQLRTSVEQLNAGIAEQDKAAHAAAMTELSKSLMDPATGIPGYDQTRHTANANYALKLGVAKDFVEGLTDPAAWRIIDQARRFSDAQKGVASAKAVPATKVPKPAIRSRGDNSDSSTTKAVTRDRAMATLKETGSREAGIDALAAMGL